METSSPLESCLIGKSSYMATNWLQFPTEIIALTKPEGWWWCIWLARGLIRLTTHCGYPKRANTVLTVLAIEACGGVGNWRLESSSI